MPLKIASKNHVASTLREILAYVETESKPNKHVVIGALHRVKMALADNVAEAVEAMGPIQANSREEVMKGFKKSNPSLTDAQLSEIADQWEKNKSVVKDKHAGAIADDKQSRHEEGKHADPTKDMSPADAAKWKAENAKHKDDFKAAGRRNPTA